MAPREGSVEWSPNDYPDIGLKTWYSIHHARDFDQDQGVLPLVVLHGGPGIPHGYLVNLVQAFPDRPIIFYDQLGCGQSEYIDAKTGALVWNLKSFREEFFAVLKHLGVQACILYGQSMGAYLAADFAAMATPIIKGVIISSGFASFPELQRVNDALVSSLSSGTQDVIQKATRSGDFESEDFAQASQEFYDHYVCTVAWPDFLNDAYEAFKARPEVYSFCSIQVYGPSDFTVTGALAGEDLFDRLPSIHVPTLVLSGSQDWLKDCQPALIKSMTGVLPTVRVIENSSHFPHIEQVEEHNSLLREWIEGNLGPAR